MTTLNAGSTLSGQYRHYISTGAADDDVLGWSTSPQEAVEWQRLIDDKLLEWVASRHRFADDDFTPPNRPAIEMAIDTASALRDEGVPAPSRVAPSGDGGVVFEWHRNSVYSSLEFSADGEVDQTVFVDGRLTMQHRIR